MKRPLSFDFVNLNSVADMRLPEIEFTTEAVRELPEYPGFYLKVRYSINQLFSKLIPLVALRS